MNPYNNDELATIMAGAAEIDRLDSRFELEGPLLFADMTEEMTSPWPDDGTRDFVSMLEEARSRGDEEADRAIESFYAASNRPPGERFYTDAMSAIARSDAQGYGPLARFLTAPPVLPAWADIDQIRHAQRFYADFRTAAHIGLFFGSMPLSYAASKGCQPLGLVSTLTGDTERRLWESARFLEDVFTTPFWEPGSDGYQSIRGVRLFHASVRHTIDCDSVHIVNRPSELGGRAWDPDWGRPINQEDLMAGAFDFGLGAIHVMGRFGVAFEPDDARSYLHTWLVIGAMLGVEPELLASPTSPDQAMTLEEAQYAARVILFRQIGPTTPGRRLMDGLLALMDEWFPWPFRRVPRSMLYAALNDQLAAVLGLPPPGRPERRMLWLQDQGRSWREQPLYKRMFRFGVKRVGQQWLNWWEREYDEVPPYRKGGFRAVEDRIPMSLHLTIESLGEIEDLSLKLAGLEGIEATVSNPPDDEGYEGIGLTTIVQATAVIGHGLRGAVKQMRDLVNAAGGIRRAELLVDGTPVPLGRLTDAEIDALFPA